MKKKCIALLLTVILIFSFGLIGCKTGGDVEPGEVIPTTPPDKSELNLEGELIIKAMNKGYGTKFLEAIAKAYEKENPKATVKIFPDGNIADTVSTELGLGANGNKTDIYFGAGINYADYYMNADLEKFGKSSLLKDLTPFLKSWLTYDEQNKMDEILDSGLVDMLSIQDKTDPKIDRTFALPWAGGACGLVYNEELFIEAGVKVPTTTDELIATFASFKAYNTAHPDKAITPIIYGGGNSMAYWQYLTYVWWAQYEGFDNFMKYWTLSDGDPFVPVQSYITQEGQKKAIEVSEKLIQGEHVYSGSAGMTVDIAEKYFVKGNGKERYAMMPNGDWFENETKGAAGEFADNFKMMKTPKLSAAITKAGGADKVEDYAYTLASTHNLFIPSYSEEQDLALDFLSFYYSEMGSRLYYENTGAFLPRTNYDYLTKADKDKMTKFKRSSLELIDQTKFVFSAEFKSPLRYFGGLGATPEGKKTPEGMMIDGDGMTAEAVFNEYDNYFKSNWGTYLENAGIN